MGRPSNAEIEVPTQSVQAYRAAARSWLFKSFSEATGYPVYMVTLTLKDTVINGSVISEHDPNYCLKVAVRAIEAAGLHGVVFVESAKRGGRIHAHGLVLEVNDGGISLLRDKWTGADPTEPLYGFCVLKQVTDLLGAVHYVTKAFGPESPVRWTREVQRCLTGLAMGDAGTAWDAVASAVGRSTGVGEALAGGTPRTVRTGVHTGTVRRTAGRSGGGTTNAHR